MTPEQKQQFEALVRLEISGGLPPGYTLTEKDGVWSWVYEGSGGSKRQRCGEKPAAIASAWGHFYKELIGPFPPGYVLAEEDSPGQDRHIWVHEQENIRSFPKASPQEAAGEAWTDFKAVLIGANRPPHQEAGDDPRAIMARFQQASFQLVGVLKQKRELEQQEVALSNLMEKLIEDFNKSIVKYQPGSGPKEAI
jgi:hypothetical protein